MKSGRYKPYEQYKDSGIEWLGEIPEHWDSANISKLFKINAGGDLQVNYFSEIKTQKHCFPIYTNANDKNAIYGYSCKNNYEANTITVSGRGDIGFAVFRDHPYDAIIRLLVLSPIKQQHCKFFSYYINDVIDFRVESSAIGQLSTNQIAPYKVVFPHFREQTQIANFLDHETAKIDTLIEKQKRLIKLLKEKRQAVISHAVTKGLNPDAPMKDSGVEWLGEVPEHWVIKNYRYSSKIYRGKFGHRPRNDPSLYDGEYPFIQTGDIARAQKKITSYTQTLNEKGKSISQRFPAGSLVMAIAANIGDTAILDFEAYAPDSVVGFKPNSDIFIDFLKYSLMASLPALEKTSTQSTQANLNIDRIGAVKSIFPPLKEQFIIVSVLDKQERQYQSIEKKAIDAITLLQERRTALISAAVTGKIDVRDWVAPDNDNTPGGEAL
ncbi:restriction endonuclease subunit S [Oceanispirochaeta sp.]|jgi:type I restriction enzyme S subunit|uniref:restriction endonuclease subunit S n=1 Tax=Oceanispirochaeta sp. TaxID=2035350 RepID=UPI00262CAC33|nr:restriction endonuclease subunit S [Oceanispirochaeta sp.]MDA3955838.1 restriction endonuclease subunit S [Oceanispirochaeta sp.]